MTDSQARADYERKIASTWRARWLQRAIFKAINRYIDYLVAAGVAQRGNPAMTLVVSVNFADTNIYINLPGGALDALLKDGGHA